MAYHTLGNVALESKRKALALKMEKAVAAAAAGATLADLVRAEWIALAEKKFIDEEKSDIERLLPSPTTEEQIRSLIGQIEAKLKKDNNKNAKTIVDTLKSTLDRSLTAIKTASEAAAAAAAAAPPAAPPASSSASTTPLLIGGLAVAAVAAVFILKRKKG